MGKSLPSTSNLQQVAKILPTQKPKPKKPPFSLHPFKRFEKAATRLPAKTMEEASSLPLDGRTRSPLSQVVSDCVKRWFQDTLKEARAGDVTMQVLVAQMYNNGYGVPQDARKGRIWINRASKSRPSVVKVIDKHPGRNATDSDTDDAI